MLFSQQTQSSSAAVRVQPVRSNSFGQRTKRDFIKNKSLYFMIFPVLVFYVMFCYVPMYGLIIAFKDFSLDADLGYFLSVLNSPFVGLDNFKEFFGSFQAKRVIVNTLRISFSTLVFGFPAPIILALLINEVRIKPFKSVVQTITYLPHFISLVVICGMIKDFTSDTGFITTILSKIFGFEPFSMLGIPELFVPIYVISDIWQGVGWGSIVYLAALTSIDTQLYEAARIDGANKFRLLWHVSLPGIASTIIVMLILRMGQMLNVGYEKIILLYNPTIYETADVISSYNYRTGLLGFQWSYSAAVGLFNSVINCIFLFGTNWLSRKYSDVGLW